MAMLRVAGSDRLKWKREPFIERLDITGAELGVASIVAEACGPPSIAAVAVCAPAAVTSTRRSRVCSEPADTGQVPRLALVGSALRSRRPCGSEKRTSASVPCAGNVTDR